MALKKLWIVGALPVVLIVGGLGGVYGHLLPAPKAIVPYLPAYRANLVSPDPPITAKNAVTITMPAVESNLGSHSHYIQIVVSFNVTAVALAKAGATGTAAAATSGGGSGTSSTALNNQLEAMITSVARAGSYAALQTPAGVAALRQVILAHLQTLFGHTQVDNVLFPTLITQ